MIKIKLILLLLIKNAYFLILPIQELRLKDEINTRLVKVIETKVFCENIVLVNVNDETLLRNLHNTFRFDIINRSFLSFKLDIYNEAYIIHSQNYSELINGLEDLKKDFFWNPKAVFTIILQKIVEDDISKAFQDLHNIYVFDIHIIITENYTTCFTYTYNFNKSARCSFTLSAINRNQCEETTPEDKTKSNAMENNNRIPYYGCKNITFIVVPIVPNTFGATDGDRHRTIGYEEIFYTIMQDMGFFNFTFIFAEVDDSIGFMTENYTVTGLMKQVHDGIADGIFGGILISRNRIGIFDIVHPHLSDELVMLIHRAKVLEKWKAMFLAFTSSVWSLILFSFVVFCVAAIKFKIFGQYHARNNAYMILTLFGYFVGTTHKSIDNHGKVRLMVISWAVFTWLIVCFYQSHLASVFTKPTFQRQIQSMEEMYQENFGLHLFHRTFSYMNATKALDFGDMMSRISICDTVKQTFDVVASDEKAGTVSSLILYNYYKAGYLDVSLIPKIYVVKPTVSHVYSTAYIRKGHPDLEKLRFLERQVIAGYFHRKRIDDLIYQKSLSYHYKINNFAGSLRLKQIEGLYYFVLLSGCSVSFIVFLGELYSKKC